MPKAVSCGFIIFDRATGMVLACHPNGKDKGPDMAYDIPKGHLEEGESPMETAIRELREETGMTLPHDAPIHDIGLVPYQTHKSLYLFSTSIRNLPGIIGSLHCDSKFVDSFGNEKREVDSYATTTDPGWFFKNMQKYIRAEMARVTMEPPVFTVMGYAGDRETEVLMKVSCTDSDREKYISDLNFMTDRNMYPYGFGGTVELADGREVSVELDDLVSGIRDRIAVDIDGSYRELPDFPIADWFSVAREGTVL